LIEIGSKTAEKNSAQTNRQTDTTKIMVTWPWTNYSKESQTRAAAIGRPSYFLFHAWFHH